MFCDTYGATLTFQDFFTCYLWNVFGGDYTLIFIGICALFLFAAYKFHLNSTIALVIAWAVSLFLWDLSGQTNYMMGVVVILTSIAAGARAFFVILERFDK